jgi:predicted outer membrane repeat protein
VLTLTDCTISGNSDAGGTTGNPTPLAKGGGVAFAGGGSLVIMHCLFEGNFASNLTTHSGVGGAVDYQLLNTGVPGSLSITNSIFNNNSAAGTGNGAGGAIRVVDTTNTQPRSVTINRNQFTGNHASDPLNSGDGGAIAATGKNPITVQFNRFRGNTATGSGAAIYQATGTLGTINAAENWWGCNAGPGNAGCDGIGGLTASITSIPRLVLAHSASPAAVPVGQTVTFTASFLEDSNHQPVSPANLSGLAGMPVAFTNPLLGVITSQQTSLQASGTASAAFLATEVGTGSLTAVVDNASVIAQVTINKALVYLPLVDHAAWAPPASIQRSSANSR